MVFPQFSRSMAEYVASFPTPHFYPCEAALLIPYPPQRVVFLGTMIPFTLCHLGGSLAQNATTLLVMRFFAGMFGSSRTCQVWRTFWNRTRLTCAYMQHLPTEVLKFQICLGGKTWARQRPCILSRLS